MKMLKNWLSIIRSTAAGGPMVLVALLLVSIFPRELEEWKRRTHISPGG